jgi:hypothetical protein
MWLLVRLNYSLPHTFRVRYPEKDIQNYGKNFPVNKAWVPAFAGMTAIGGVFGKPYR